MEAIFRDHSQYLTEPRMEAAARENIQGNILWMERNAEKVCKWLNEQGWEQLHYPSLNWGLADLTEGIARQGEACNAWQARPS